MDRLTRERLDGIDRKLSHLISLVHGLVLEAAENDEQVLRYRPDEKGNLQARALKPGNGKG